MALPMTGSASLLELLSAFVPDDHINDLLPRHDGRGRRSEWSAAQLYRVLLLLLLTPARSSNLLCALLPEQRSWRQFAHLPNRRCLPNVRQLHEFRARLTPAVLRDINEHLLQRLLAGWPKGQLGVGLMDATDLPAATNEYKKRAAAFPRTKRRWEDAPKRRARAGGSLATKNTRSDFGWPTTRSRSSWCR
jgi:hypothetical protein